MRAEYLLVEQGSEEWLDLRRGVITATKMAKCFTARGAISDTGIKTLARELVSEILEQNSGEFVETYVNEAMERGQRLEPEAIETLSFELQQSLPNVVIKPGGFYLDRENNLAASPDGIVEVDGSTLMGVEIKCPLAKNHTKYLLESGVPSNYRVQVQMNLMLSGLDKWVFASYYPGAPMKVVTVEADKEFHETLFKVSREVMSLVKNYREVVGI